ncbi:DNA repair protein RadC [Paenalcaligenes hominis]|uniref:DNA repair protein RadC n=1 Tax=Paenalcaligenes hominis TaxID=643674 RepID=A0ABX0WMW9_9BURK|nr:hypothetical protein [Paenalcaligenes hominis]NJB64602.1 DNA repair protein RadC [Paenalcaligenes hominis]GGE60471.1 hypothetical protein GCM10007278_05880 [Paenalcaligenes hominis]
MQPSSRQKLLQDYEHEVFAVLLLDAKHKALALVDVRVLDHIVVGAKGGESLAESGAI